MRFKRRTWLTLVACAAAAGGVAAQAPSPVDAAPPPEKEDGGGMVVPPLNLRGTLSYDFRAARGGDDSRFSSHLLTGNISGRSYIYAPWFSAISGNLGLSTETSHETNPSLLFTDGSSQTLAERIHARQQFVTGSARLDLFPRSRFPFEVHFQRDDSRNDAGLGTVFDFRTQNLGFSQQYRPPDGRYQVAGSFEHREQSGLGFNSKQNTLNGDFNTRWKANDLSIGAGHSRARDVGTDNDSRFDTIVARHNYVPSSELSVNSTANWTRTRETALVAPSDLQAMQLSTVGLWRAEGSKLSLNGSARALSLREDVAGTSLDSLGAALGASYEFDEHLRLTGNGGVNATRSDGRDSGSLNGGIGIAYQGDTLTFRDIRYEWFTSGSLSGNTTHGDGIGGDDNQFTANAQLGHSATRLWRLGEASDLSLTGSQTLAWTHNVSSRHEGIDPSLADSRTLLNNLAATWQRNQGQGSTFARASYSDALELGGQRSRFRLFNFQLSGTIAIDNRRSLTGDLTYQRSLQRSGAFVLDGLEAGGQRSGTSSASGEITYRENNLFGMPQLRFVSRLRLAQDMQKQPGQMLSLPDRETRLWENRLDWNIGRLESQIVLRLSEIAGRQHQSLIFRVQRSFGD
jgi:hypothetical protein